MILEGEPTLELKGPIAKDLARDMTELGNFKVQ